MKRLLFLLLLALPLSAGTLPFHVIGIDCAGCAKPITKALSSIDGVKNVKLDWKSGTASVDVPDGFDRERVRTALTNAGFEVVFPGEVRKDLEALPEAERAKLDIATDAKGAKIDVAKRVVPGKITIIDLYADWCGPCQVLETRLERYMQAHPEVALRRVNIGKWNTPAAVQATREFHAEALPYIRVYDRQGTFKASVTGGMWDEVLAALEAADGRPQTAD